MAKNKEIAESKGIENAVKLEKKAKRNFKFPFVGEGSVDGYIIIKKGDAVPAAFEKDNRFKKTIELFFE